jgi:hypothetical protein
MSDDAPVKIVGMNIIQTQRPWDDGSRLLALFDCETRGFRLMGCLLIKTARGGFVVQPPRGENQRIANTRSIWIIDSQLRHHMMDAARRAYVAFGGTDGEYPHGKTHA